MGRRGKNKRGRAAHTPPTPRPDPAAALPAESKQALTHQPDHYGDPRDLAALLSYGPANIPYTFGWTDSRVEQVRAYKHWVYVAVKTIATTVAAQVPNVSHVYCDPADAPGKSAPWPLRERALTPLASHQRLEAAEDDHPLVRLLQDPNDPDTAYDVWYETALFYFLTGSAYWWLPPNPLGLPGAAWVLPSHWVWPVLGKDSYLSGYEIRPVEGNYLRRFFPAEEIVHFRMKNPISKLDGHSPLTAGSQWADVSDSVNKATWQAYKNGTFPTVAVQFDGKLQDPSDEDLRRIEAKFLARYAGEMRSNKPLFLPPGVKVTPLAIAPNEMVFGETQERMRDNILALYCVPKLVAGIMDGMTYGSILAAQAGFFTFAVNPFLHFMGQVLTEKLARRYDESLKVWWESRTPDDPELTEKRIQTDILCAAICPDEVRVMRGRAPFDEEWSRKPILPVNMQPLATPGGGAHSPIPNVVPDEPSAGKDEKAVSRFDLNGHAKGGN